MHGCFQILLIYLPDGNEKPTTYLGNGREPGEFRTRYHPNRIQILAQVGKESSETEWYSTLEYRYTRVYQKVSGLVVWSENCK
jgi:hypothetical protein